MSSSKIVIINKSKKNTEQLLTIRIRHIANIEKTLNKYGKQITEGLQSIITSGTRSGRTYLYKGVRYTASAPSEPPANRTGRLASSFRYDLHTLGMNVYSTARSDNGAPYPAFLEEGTSKMEARPYFKLVNERYQKLIQRGLSSVKK